MAMAARMLRTATTMISSLRVKPPWPTGGLWLRFTLFIAKPPFWSTGTYRRSGGRLGTRPYRRSWQLPIACPPRSTYWQTSADPIRPSSTEPKSLATELDAHGQEPSDRHGQRDREVPVGEVDPLALPYRAAEDRPQPLFRVGAGEGLGRHGDRWLPKDCAHSSSLPYVGCGAAGGDLDLVRLFSREAFRPD